MSGIGDRLLEERKRLKLSQVAMGELAGVHSNAQRNYEKGARSPDAGYLAAVAEAGVDVRYVITGERHSAPEASMGEIDTAFLAEIAEQLDRIIRQAGKKPSGGADYVRMVAEVYNFMVQEGTRDAETTSRVLRLVVNR